MRCGVDEVGEAGQGGREPDDGPVERDDEDFRVRVEGLCDVEVVGDEVFEEEAVLVFPRGGRAVDADVGAAVGRSAASARVLDV